MTKFQVYEGNIKYIYYLSICLNVIYFIFAPFIIQIHIIGNSHSTDCRSSIEQHGQIIGVKSGKSSYETAKELV